MRTPRRLSLFFFVVFSLSLAACDGCEDGCAAKGEEGASTPKERSALSEAEDFAAEIDATVSDDVEALTQADIDRFRTELENMLKLLAEATQAGIDAERGDSHCERALTGMRALVDHVAEKRGEPARPIDGPAFIQTCEGFDVEIQRCIVLSYSQAHQDECSAVIDAAPPGTVVRIQALLGSN